MKFKTYFISPYEKFIPEKGGYDTCESYTAYGAKKERVAFQIVIEALEDVSGICFKAEPFRMDSSKYRQIDAAFLKLYTVGSVHISENTEGNENIYYPAPANYPDPLETSLPVSLKKGQTHDLFVTVDIPEYTGAGDYTSYFMIYSSFEDKIVLDAKLHVFDFTLDADLFEITRWPNIGNIPRLFNAPVGSDKFFDALDHLAILMKRYGESLVFTPWNEMVSFERQADGSFRIDSWILRKYIAVFKNRGFRKFAYRHISWRDQWVTTYMLGWSLKVIEPDGSVTYTDACDFYDPQYQELIKAFLKDIENIAEIDKDGVVYYTHLFDEPVKYHNALYKDLVAFVHGIAPSIKLIEAMRSADPVTYGLLDACVPLWGTDLQLKDQISGDFYWYICMEPKGGFSNRFIDQNPACYRSVPWLGWLYGIKGYLEWGLNYYGDGLTNSALSCDPRKNSFVSIEVVDPNGMMVSPGDGFLVYPDDDVFYIPSLRIEIFHAGLEEYKYLKMLDALAAKGNKEAAAMLDEVRGFLKDTLQYSKRIEDYDEMKIKMGKTIESAGVV